MGQQQAPTKILYHRRSRELHLVFGESEFVLSAEFLRVHSPSAEVRGHGSETPILQLNKQDVRVENIEAQGNYAIRIAFSDGHNSGIYTWSYLFELGSRRDEYWSRYRQKVNDHHSNKDEHPKDEVDIVRWVNPK